MRYNCCNFDSLVNCATVAKFCIYIIYDGPALNKRMISLVKNNSLISPVCVSSQVYNDDIGRLFVIRVC